MKILIITVGNRQVGWRCQDGIARCLGVSGNRNDTTIPDHVSELYQEIEVDKPQSHYFIRDLGERFYRKCEEIGDYGAVELLLDQKILDQEAENDLEEVWLIGTDQPSSKVSDSFRSGDTLWLSKLMAGKIKQIWKNLRVETWDLKADVSDIEIIREEYEEFWWKMIS